MQALRAPPFTSLPLCTDRPQKANVELHCPPCSTIDAYWPWESLVSVVSWFEADEHVVASTVLEPSVLLQPDNHPVAIETDIAYIPGAETVYKSLTDKNVPHHPRVVDHVNGHLRRRRLIHLPRDSHRYRLVQPYLCLVTAGESQHGEKGEKELAKPVHRASLAQIVCVFLTNNIISYFIYKSQV